MLNVPFSQHQNSALLHKSSLLWTIEQEETGHYLKKNKNKKKHKYKPNLGWNVWDEKKEGKKVHIKLEVAF